MKSSKAIKQIILASVLTAIITVLTFFVKIPVHNGYLHIGDSAIYIAAALLPTPFAMVCASLGGAISDAAGGFIIYIIPTAIIKGIIASLFSNKENKIISKRNIFALVPASIVTIGGYYLAEVILLTISSAGFKGLFEYILTSAPWIAAVYSLPGNIIQAIGSAVVFIFLGSALDKIKIKDRI